MARPCSRGTRRHVELSRTHNQQTNGRGDAQTPTLQIDVGSPASCRARRLRVGAQDPRTPASRWVGGHTTCVVRHKYVFVGATRRGARDGLEVCQSWGRLKKDSEHEGGRRWIAADSSRACCWLRRSVPASHPRARTPAMRTRVMTSTVSEDERRSGARPCPHRATAAQARGRRGAPGPAAPCSLASQQTGIRCCHPGRAGAGAVVRAIGFMARFCRTMRVAQASPAVPQPTNRVPGFDWGADRRSRGVPPALPSFPSFPPRGCACARRTTRQSSSFALHARGLPEDGKQTALVLGPARYGTEFVGTTDLGTGGRCGARTHALRVQSLRDIMKI